MKTVTITDISQEVISRDKYTAKELLLVLLRCYENEIKNEYIEPLYGSEEELETQEHKDFISLLKKA